jgi:hypothetical protein
VAIVGFRETFGPGGRYYSAEETDLFFRLLQSGEEVTYAPEILVFHPASSSIEPMKAYRYAYATGAVLAVHALQDRANRTEYLRVYLRKLLICAGRRLQVGVMGPVMAKRNIARRYSDVLRGLVHGGMAGFRDARTSGISNHPPMSRRG